MEKEDLTPTQIGRPRSAAAVSHAAIIDAVYKLLKDISVRDLTMEAVAKRAGVGKPTLYKWWPSKAALVMAMFHERIAPNVEIPKFVTAEEAIRAKMRRTITEFTGMFGKVIADLIAEGQNDPDILKELYDGHIRPRRESLFEDIRHGKAMGEFVADVDLECLTEMMFAPIFYRLLLGFAPITQEYGSQLIDQGLQAVRRKRTKRSANAK